MVQILIDTDKQVLVIGEGDALRALVAEVLRSSAVLVRGRKASARGR